MEANLIFEASELSLVAYSDFTAGILDTQKDALKDAGMSELQAKNFIQHYNTVIATYNDPSTSFSATIFENRQGDALTLAIRGSGVVDWVTANPDILIRGAAYRQIVELYNWWSRITAPLGELVEQYVISSYLASVEPSSPNAIFLYDSGLLVPTKIYLESTAEAAGTGELAARIDAQLLVTGHSLGGHLAMAFSSIFSADTEETVVFNAPGFLNSEINRQFFQTLGAATIPLGDRITNVVGKTTLESTGDWSIIAGLHSQPGKAVEVAIEDQVLSGEPHPDTPSLNHSMQQLVDSAAVYAFLNQLDPSLDSAKFESLFQSSSNSEYKTLERILDSVANMLGRVAPNLETGNDQRDALYQSIYDIQASDAFKALVAENVSIDTNFASLEARDNFDVFLATVNLSPLVIHANDLGAQLALEKLHAELASNWRQDQSLMDGARHFTDQYLQDRGLMRSTLLESNLRDELHGRLTQKVKFTNLDSNSTDSITFDGDANGYLAVDHSSPLAFDPYRARYVFGSEADEDPSRIVASNNNDHLYGMGGNDHIMGLEGIDHIEGGLGNDLLEGGQGGDVLRGGSGTDFLVGGEGVDSLNGGAGADHFYWESGDGDDVIVDYDDGGDRIFINGVDLSLIEFERNSIDSPFFYSHAHPQITLHYEGSFLTVSAGRGDGAGSITAMQYAPALNADYGIKLLDYAPDPFPTTAVTVAKLGGSNEESANQTGVAAYYRQQNHQRGLDWSSTTITFDGSVVQGFTGDTAHGILRGTFEGGPVDDVLLGNGYGNSLYGLSGDDYIDGKQEGDYIEGGAGSDILFGSEGSDVLYGSSAALLRGWYNTGSDYDQFYLSKIIDAPDDVNTISGGAGQDFVTGGEYADYIDGGEGRDYLFGGTGDDYISGGIDRDIIYGDSSLYFYWLELAGGSIGESRRIVFADGTDGVGEYDDVIYAGDGDDVVFGELGDDTIFGEAGNDTLVGDRSSNNVYYTSPYSSYGDTSPALDVALHGDDKLYGGAGADILMGLGGSDLLAGGADNDTLIGGAGDDIYLFQAGDGKDLIQDFAGKHTLLFNGVPSSELRIEFQGSHVFVGSGAADAESEGEGFFLYTSEWSNTSIALETPDAILERARLDTLYFDGGGNLLVELKGSNGLSEAQRNTLFTVDSSEIYKPKIVISEGVEQVLLAGHVGDAGASLRIAKGAIEYHVELSATQLANGGDFIRLPDGVNMGVTGLTGVTPGSDAGDWIIGSEGADVLNGYGGDDVLEGRGGNDRIVGGTGLDYLFGGDGDDVLEDGSKSGDGNYFNGGRGNDTLLGGYGSDRYVFTAGDGQDRLSDSQGLHYFEFAAGVDPGAVLLYYTDTTGSRIRLEYGGGDALVTEGDFSVAAIAGVQVAGINIPLVQRSDLENGTFYDSHMNDVFEPGAGNDTLYLRGSGTDVFRFGAGDGQDLIKLDQNTTSRPHNAQIRFAADVDLNAITFRFQNADAVIGYGVGDEITLDTDSVISNLDNAFVRFRLVSEADPLWMPVMRVQQSGGDFYGSFGAEHIIGSDGAELIVPGYGNDIIEAGDSGDFIVLNEAYLPGVNGSIGNKSVSGQHGDDFIVTPLYQGLTFHYDAGDGHDTIQFDWSYSPRRPYRFTINQHAATAAFMPYGQDTLAFGPGISRADLRFVRVDDDLKILLTGDSGSVTLEDFFPAWDVQRTPEAASALFSIMDSAARPNVDTLLAPAVLAVLPTTPISFIRFAGGDLFNMALELADVLEVSSASINGTEGDDQLYGTEADDVIFAYGGNDYIEDLEGRNTIDAGSGDDRIEVNGGNAIDAGSGNDNITVDGNNTIHAGEGNDFIFATGDNLISGGPGTDVIQLYEGNNVLEFGPGDGNDYVDFMVGPDAGTTTLSLAAGITLADIRVYLVTADGSESVQIYLPATGDSFFPQAMVASEDGSTYTPHPRATLTEVRFADGTVVSGDELFAMVSAVSGLIEGTDGDDRIVGTPEDDFIIGGRGDDILRGEAGNDNFGIQGHDQGADRIFGGEGFDSILGSEGDDTITLSAMPIQASIEMINGGAGVNILAGTSDANVLYFANTQIQKISRIEGLDGDDKIWGSQGDDVIVGGRGNDVLRGEAGDDTFIIEGSDQGSDRIFGGDGQDVILGGAQDDTFFLTAMGVGSGVEVIDGGAGHNTIVGSSEDNTLNFSGTQLLNIARIEGGVGADRIWGSQGNDVLAGDVGDDRLRGEDGNDILIGGAGSDILIGDAGDDVYLFARGDGRDRINNNDALPTALDRLWITDIDYDALWLSRKGDSLLIDVVGTDDQVKIINWYKDAEDQLDVIYAGNRALMHNQVDQLVNAMAAFAVPNGVGAVIPQATRMELESTLTAVWQVA